MHPLNLLLSTLSKKRSHKKKKKENNHIRSRMVAVTVTRSQGGEGPGEGPGEGVLKGFKSQPKMGAL